MHLTLQKVDHANDRTSPRPLDIVSVGLVDVCDGLPMDGVRLCVSIKMTVTAPGYAMD